MKKKILTFQLFLFLLGSAYSQINNDTISVKEMIRIQSVINSNSENTGTKKITGNSVVGPFTGLYRITNKGTICELQAKFNDSDLGVINFFYISDTLMLIGIGEKKYYKVNNLYLFNNKESIKDPFLQQLLSFQREQVRLIGILED